MKWSERRGGEEGEEPGGKEITLQRGERRREGGKRSMAELNLDHKMNE